jgi:hypothetical protein
MRQSNTPRPSLERCRPSRLDRQARRAREDPAARSTSGAWPLPVRHRRRARRSWCVHSWPPIRNPGAAPGTVATTAKLVDRLRRACLRCPERRDESQWFAGNFVFGDPPPRSLGCPMPRRSHHRGAQRTRPPAPLDVRGLWRGNAARRLAVQHDHVDGGREHRQHRHDHGERALPPAGHAPKGSALHSSSRGVPSPAPPTASSSA